MEDKENVMHINLSDLDANALLKRGEKDTKTIALRMNKNLLQLVRKKIEEIRNQGYRLSLNSLIHHLLLAFLNSRIQIKDNNKINIIINNIEIEERVYRKRSDVMHMHMHMHMHCKKDEMPDELKSLIRRVINALRNSKYWSKEKKYQVLGELLEELYKYKDWPLAQHYISVIEFELGR